MSKHAPTLGERRAGIDFNPSGDDRISDLKRRAAAAIDAVADIPDDGDSEIRRLKAVAQTGFESAAMWAVKAAARSAQRGGG